MASRTELVLKAAVGEMILRRWLHDGRVDSLAAMLQPLGIDCFPRPTTRLRPHTANRRQTGANLRNVTNQCSFVLLLGMRVQR